MFRLDLYVIYKLTVLSDVFVISLKLPVEVTKG